MPSGSASEVLSLLNMLGNHFYSTIVFWATISFSSRKIWMDVIKATKQTAILLVLSLLIKKRVESDAVHTTGIRQRQTPVH